MADKNLGKEDLKKQKADEKAAEKAKKERIKQSKPKKEGNPFSRGGAAVKKFCKDFVGTCKKVSWPTGKQVIKNSGVVLATIVVIGLAVAGIDYALTGVFNLAKDGAVQLGEKYAIVEETTTAATETTTAATETTSAETTSEEESTTDESGTGEVSTEDTTA